MSDDPQEVAESLDDDVVDVVDDRSGDEFGEALPQYPPDRPLGVNTVGVTAVEEDAGESLAERVLREQPEDQYGVDGSAAPGQRPTTARPAWTTRSSWSGNCSRPPSSARRSRRSTSSRTDSR